MELDLDHIDFQYNWIETYIKTAAHYMETHSEADIVEAFEKRNVNGGDIFLIMQAARLLYNDRQSAPPKKTLIKRI